MMKPEQFAYQLADLHQQMQVFAEKYPEHARQLNLNELKDKDPHVERLLEGVAFMNAKIQQRIDADIAEVSQNFIEQLWPDLLRPIPSLTIMQILPRVGQLQAAYSLAKGTLLSSAPVGPESMACHFSTTETLSILPLHLVSVQQEATVNGGTIIQLRLQAEPEVDWTLLQTQPLSLYVSAESYLQTAILQALTQSDNRVHISFPDLPEQRHIGLPNGAIQLKKITHENVLLPSTGRDHLAHRLLHEYFAFPEKYHFVEVLGWETLAFPALCQTLVINIETTATLPNKLLLSKEHIHLNCVPAINLYSATSEPLTIEQQQLDYTLVADTKNRESVNVYRIDSAVAVDTASGERCDLASFFDFRQRQANSAYFHARVESQSGGKVEHKVSVHQLNTTEKQRLSCTVQVHNGYYPRKFLRENEIHRAQAELNFGTIKNRTRPSELRMLPQRGEYQWQLIQHLRLGLKSIRNVTDLQQVLDLYNWSENLEHQKMIQGILELTLTPIEYIQRGGLRFGVRVDILLDEAQYSAFSDIYHFSKILHDFFCLQAPVNTSVRTHIRCANSAKTLAWGM